MATSQITHTLRCPDCLHDKPMKLYHRQRHPKDLQYHYYRCTNRRCQNEWIP